MTEKMREIGQRMQGLREACDVTVEEMAADLEVTPETYLEWEATGKDVPISALYHMSRKFGVELTDLVTGTDAKLTTYQVVRRGGGKVTDRTEDYHFEDMAWRFADKIMQPLVVILEPSDEPVHLQSHAGQEFNFVIEGTMAITLNDKEFVLNQWDSIYFDPEIPHGQRCVGDKKAKFVTVIAE